MKQHLLIIDMQNDFITGSLRNEDGIKIIPKIKEQLESFRIRAENGEEANIIYTRDTHAKDYLQTAEGKKLPVEHCIKGTQGWEIVPELEPTEDGFIHGYELVVDKPTFGYTRWKDVATVRDGDVFHVCGVCTDICVVSNCLILKAVFPNSEIIVHANSCAGLTPEKHKAALEVLSSCQCVVVED